VRQAELALLVELKWTDLRTGEVLSRPSRRPGEALRPEGPGTPPVFDPNSNPALRGAATPPAMPTRPGSPEVPVLPPPTPGAVVVVPPETIPPVQVRTTTRFTLELGQSISTAEQDLFRQTARQIVHLMEKSW